MGKPPARLPEIYDEALGQLELTELARIASWAVHPDYQAARAVLLLRLENFLHQQLRRATAYLGVFVEDNVKNDVLQELHVFILNNLPKYDPRWSLTTFLHDPLYYKALNLLSKAFFGQKHLICLDDDTAWEGMSEPSAVYAERAEHALIATDVERFKYALSDDQQELLAVVYWDGQTQADVARRLGVSRAAVTQRLDRIHRQGRRWLARWEGSVA